MSIHVCLLFALLLANPVQEHVIGQPARDFDPALVDVNGVYVVVDIVRHPAPGPNDAEFGSRLAELLQVRLDEAGIPVTPPMFDQLDEGMRPVVARRVDVVNGDPNTMRFRMANVPTLRVAVDLAPFEAQGSVVLCVRTCFVRQVQLSARNQQSFPATVWIADPVMKAVRSSQWRDEVEEVVLDQVDKFIAARKTAAPHDGEIHVPLHTLASSGNAASASAYPFIASKNSSVFHRADCRMAGTIAAENLVGYNSRDEAVAAGKRPCRTCNP